MIFTQYIYNVAKSLKVYTVVTIYIILPSSTFYEAKGVGLVWDILKEAGDKHNIIYFLKNPVSHRTFIILLSKLHQNVGFKM